MAHTASDLPISERMDYLRVLAALTAVDDDIAGTELGALGEFCDALGVAGQNKEEVFAFAHDTDNKRVRATCERLRDSQLRYTLVTDLLYIAYTDQTYSSEEREVVEGIAELLHIDARQLDAMETYAQHVLRARVGRLPSDPAGEDDDDSSANIAGGLAAAGVPLTAVALAGGGGLAQGLAVLGGAALGAGAAAGAGVAAGIGVVSFFAVRGLYRSLFG
jgi:uncharacterized tellurite resistance protein B-like protein